MAATWNVVVDWTPTTVVTPPVTPVTPKAAELFDTFRTVDTGKWPTTTNVSSVGWRGRMTLPAVGGRAQWATGANHYDLTNSYLHLELATLPSAATSSTYLMARVSVTPTSHVLIGMEAGNLLMRQVTAGVVSDTTLTYDVWAHRWVRLEVTGTTTVLFRTSTNGRDWTTRRTLTTTLDLSSVEVVIDSLWLVTAGASARAEVAWLNLAPVTALTSYNPPPMSFGSLITASSGAANEYSKGMRVHMQEWFWDSVETADNTWDSTGLAFKVAEFAQLDATGAKITLGLGIHHTPAYVAALTNGTFKWETLGTSSQANFVFNQTCRGRAERYMDRIHTEIGFANYHTIRLTSGSMGEVLYPSEGGWWAYDANAQGTASDRPSTIAVCPYPGWIPGGTSITVLQAREWMNWYLDSLADSVNWQMRYIRAKGFTGWFEIVMPGVGTRLSTFETEATGRFGTASGTTKIGAVWPSIVQRLVDRHAVVTYCSSMADNSGTPANDVTAAGDTAVDLAGTGVANWSAARHFARIAAEFSTPSSGENPGFGAVSNTYYQDETTSGMFHKARLQAVAAKYVTFYVAHSSSLNGGTTYTIDDFKTLVIDPVNSGTNPLPPAPP